MIRDAGFVYYGPEPWQGMWRNRHQLLSRLAACNRVLYVEPRPYVDEIVAQISRRGHRNPRRAALKVDRPSLWVYSTPRYAALGGPPPLRALTHVVRQAHLGGALKQVGISHPLVWISSPTQFDARGELAARLRVYHIVDNYLAYPDVPSWRREQWRIKEAELIHWADLVVAVTPELIANKGPDNPKFRLLPNAVDETAYAGPPPPAPSALAPLPRPWVGYVGLVSVRLDLALLDELAAAHPEWTLVLVGEVNRNGCGEFIDRLSARSNVRLLPPVPAADVPSYVRSFDVALAPYKVTAETIHASPLKIYEYLAAGLPVVAADVPGARRFSGVVSIAQDRPAWAALIERALGDRSTLASAARRAAVAGETWASRVETLSGFLSEALERTACELR